MWIESVMPSNHLILCRPLFLLPLIPLSIRVFSNESTLRMRWPKYWSFSFSIIPSKEHPGLISFRMDRLELLAVQGTLKSLLQHHSSKASILWCWWVYNLWIPDVTSAPLHWWASTALLSRKEVVWGNRRGIFAGEHFQALLPGWMNDRRTHLASGDGIKSVSANTAETLHPFIDI